MAKNPKSLRNFSSPEEKNMRKQRHLNVSKKKPSVKKVNKASAIDTIHKEKITEKRKTLYEKLSIKAKEFAEKFGKVISKKEKAVKLPKEEKSAPKFVSRFAKKIKINLARAFYALSIPENEPLFEHKQKCYEQIGNKKKPIIVKI